MQLCPLFYVWYIFCLTNQCFNYLEKATHKAHIRLVQLVHVV